jgi:dTDP-4-dehydrorhamnose 3,5-epimerase
MEGMQIEQTALEGVAVLIPKRFKDARGWFSESWNSERMAAAGFKLGFVQDNHSFSVGAGTLRGLHCQRPPHAQDKLVYCTRGVIFDVAVDIRKGSPSYGKWVGEELSAENGKQLLIPKGFLHGFVTRTDDCEVQYKCTDYYARDCDSGIRWNDPHIGIDWGLGDARPVLSDKDEMAPFLAEFDNPFVWEAGK